MTLDEFKGIVDQIAEYTKRTGENPSICIAGGEPFLNKDLEAMSKYACEKLGRKSVSVTTNLALFPTTTLEGVMKIMRMGLPTINVSLDREHLMYGREMEARVKAFFESAKHTGIRATVQNVAQTKYQEKYRWPKNIARLIPKEIKELVAKNDSYGRREFYSHKKASKDLSEWINKLKNGTATHMPPINVVMGLGIPPMYGMSNMLKVEVHFATDGKAHLFCGLDALHMTQLSLGSWRRESLREITQTNLPYKLNMIKHWIGMMRTNAAHKHQKFRIPDKDAPQKMRLFGKYASRKFEQQKKAKRNRFPRLFIFTSK
jgi:organic radical activating enzyme